MSIINKPPRPINPVIVNFHWTTNSPITPFIVNGITYPYKHQADEEPPNPTKGGRTSDSRYAVFTTGTRSGIVFDAIDSESEGNPKVVTPTGVFVLQYLWKFGDGTEATGAVVNHEYLAADPFTSATLTVTDSRGLRWTCLKSLNLVSTFGGRIVTDGIIA